MSDKITVNDLLKMKQSFAQQAGLETKHVIVREEHWSAIYNVLDELYERAEKAEARLEKLKKVLWNKAYEAKIERDDQEDEDRWDYFEGMYHDLKRLSEEDYDEY